MSVVNCGPNHKVFEITGSATGPIYDAINVQGHAYSRAYYACLSKCNRWINSTSCKPSCGNKSSWTEIISVSPYAKSSGTKINAQVTIKMRANVRCRGLIIGTAKKKITGKKK